MIKTIREENIERLNDMKQFLVDAEKHPKGNKDYIADLKLSIKRLEPIVSNG